MEEGVILGIIKFFDNEKYLDQLCAGKLYCNTPEYYRLHDGDGVSDPAESCRRSYRESRGDKDGRIVVNSQTMFVNSFTFRGYGEKDNWLHCWTILEAPKNHEEFDSLVRDIKRIRNEFGLNYAYISEPKIKPFIDQIKTLTPHEVKGREVVYSKNSMDWSPMCKNIDYQYQREYRILIGECEELSTKQLSIESEVGFDDFMIKNLKIIFLDDEEGKIYFKLNGNKDIIYNKPEQKNIVLKEITKLSGLTKKKQKMKLRNFNDAEVVEAFVNHLKLNGHPGIKIDRIPDEEKVQGDKKKDIDAVAGEFAIEHTSIDTVQNQTRDSARFLEVVKDLEEELSGTLDYWLEIAFPYDGVSTGQKWGDIRGALKSWIVNSSKDLQDCNHVKVSIPGVPFNVFISKDNIFDSGLCLLRFSPSDDNFSERLFKHLSRKAEKISSYQNQGFKTILLVESDDIALMNEDKLLDGIRKGLSMKLPNGVDQLWYADTSISSKILFHDFTELIEGNNDKTKNIE